MKQVISLLNDLGLTQTEAQIYLAGLGEESLSIQEFGQRTHIKRPTLYHAVGTLVEKGLVEERKVRNKTRFSVAAPERLHALVEREREKLDDKARQLETLLPLLAEQKEGKTDGFSVTHYRGIEGMKMVLDIAFYCKGKQWDVIAPIQNFLREYDKEYGERYLLARKYYGITSRTLWEPFPTGERASPTHRTLTPDEIKSRNPRFMPPAMQHKFQSMMILFDDKVAIFSSFEKLSAVLITSAELHAMFAALFEGIWEVSEPYT